MNQIPMPVLLAAAECTSKFNVRSYLNFIRVENSKVIATDGVRLFICEVDIDPELSLFILPSIIKELARGGYDKKGDVNVSIRELAGGLLPDEKVTCLEYYGDELLYLYDDLMKYPEVERSIPDGDYVDCMPTFNWEYIAKFQKMCKLLGSDNAIVIKPFGIDKVARIDFGNINYNAKAYVMPIKMGE